jgi:predicted Zn-dependent protease
MRLDQPDRFAMDHPASRERVASLETLVNASPYRDAVDSDADLFAFRMIQAKVAGYVMPVNAALLRYPVSDTSKPARYARAMAYFRKPDLVKALAEIQSLIKDEPNNPYFYEVLGQIYVSMSKPELGIPPYQKSVDLMPDAPQLRVGLANAQLATERPALAQPALDNLKTAIRYEDDDPFTWFEMAKAYSLLNNEPMANLATAERYFNLGAYAPAAAFAARAQRTLKTGTPDWQRAADIASVSGPEAQKQRR